MWKLINKYMYVKYTKLQKVFDLFLFWILHSSTGSRMSGPQRDRVTSDSVLHGTMLITNFSVPLRVFKIFDSSDNNKELYDTELINRWLFYYAAGSTDKKNSKQWKLSAIIHNHSRHGFPKLFPYKIHIMAKQIIITIFILIHCLIIPPMWELG